MVLIKAPPAYSQPCVYLPNAAPETPKPSDAATLKASAVKRLLKSTLNGHYSRATATLMPVHPFDLHSKPS